MIEENEISKHSNGGTELMVRELVKRMPADLLDKFQIIPSRVRKLDNSKIRIYWCHDLPGDPESEHLKNDGWKKFHKLVFVSNWQMLQYMGYYGIPWSHCIVMENAIVPVPHHKKPFDVVNLAYWSTPHRGLSILAAVFEKLANEFDGKVRLHVISSFGLYGWKQRDEEYRSLFDKLANMPYVTLINEPLPNDVLIKKLESFHILAYPSIWAETSCRVLMEAMSAGMLCVHPNYGALFETAANFTNMYQYHQNINTHAGIFYNVLKASIHQYIDSLKLSSDDFSTNLMAQKAYADNFYNWSRREQQWENFLQMMAATVKPETPRNEGFFEFKTG